MIWRDLRAQIQPYPEIVVKIVVKIEVKIMGLNFPRRCRMTHHHWLPLPFSPPQPVVVNLMVPSLPWQPPPHRSPLAPLWLLPFLLYLLFLLCHLTLQALLLCLRFLTHFSSPHPRWPHSVHRHYQCRLHNSNNYHRRCLFHLSQIT